MKPGTLYGIGVGPGDPELLTLKGLRLLRSVPLVYVPVARPGARSYAREIAAEHLDLNRQQVVELVFAMREEPAVMQGHWKANAAVIAKGLREGSDVAFVTEGDPMLFSTWVHVAAALHETLPEAPIVVVPGISSPQAAAAAAGVPLADRDERLAILPATYEREGLLEALRSFDTVVLLKVASAMDRVLDALEALHLSCRAVYIGQCGRPDQEIVRDVRELRGRSLPYFSLLIIRRNA
ncbi:MAG: precorrin-2 C(20)-methyltransferase [Chloroflexota bacterium]|nr:precorrin-2 C(20)-methyltransferase [Chloroflexota bacterium]